jgi:hypothetical protein
VACIGLQSHVEKNVYLYNLFYLYLSLSLPQLFLPLSLCLSSSFFLRSDRGLVSFPLSSSFMSVSSTSASSHFCTCTFFRKVIMSLVCY